MAAVTNDLSKQIEQFEQAAATARKFAEVAQQTADRLKTERFFSHIQFPQELTDAMGDLIGKAQAISTDELRKVLPQTVSYETGFEVQYDAPHAMPSPFVKCTDGHGNAGFLCIEKRKRALEQ